MKKWILAALAVLLVWNVILTCFMLNNSFHPNDSGGVAENVVTDYTTDLSEMADRVRSSVVSVVSRQNGVRHTAAGFIYAYEDKTAYIFTSDQIADEESELSVVFDSGTVLDVRIAAVDPVTSCALVTAEVPFDVTPVRTGSSDLIRQGEYVLAMGGRSLQTAAAPVSFGIASETGQRRLLAGSTWFASAVEIDTAVTADMLGGPLFNIGGEVVGMIATRAGAGADRMAYALSVNELKILFAEMAENGSVTRASIGTVVRDVKTMRAYEKNERNIPLSQSQGVMITYIAEYSAADGILLVNDILLAADGTEINDTADLRQILYSRQSGDEIIFSVLRDGEQTEVSVTAQ